MGVGGPTAVHALVRRPTETVPPWTVRVWLEDERAPVEEATERCFASKAEATAWAMTELQRLQQVEGHRLGGQDCLAYAARVQGPGQLRRTAFVFSTWEPVEWDWPSSPS